MLGDLTVSRGNTIEGVVTNASGQPIHRAVVKLEGRTALATNALGELMLGNFTTTTDSQGRYRFDGISSAKRSFLSATSLPHDGISLRQPVPRFSATMDLVVLPVGEVEVELAGAFDRAAVVIRSLAHRGSFFHCRVDVAGRCRIANVPEGNYEVVKPRGSIAPSQITVVGGQTTTVAVTVT